MLEKKPFVRYTLDEDKNPDDITFTVRLSPKDKDWFLPAKIFIKQPKPSTALKQLAQIGAAYVLHDKKTNLTIDIIQNNNRRNDRLGIPQSELEQL